MFLHIKKISVLTILVFSCMLFAESAYAQTIKVAVYVEGEIGNDYKSIVSSAVLARMSGNKKYIPCERNEAFIKALTKEQDYQLSGEISEKEIRKIGEPMGVDYVVAVNVVIPDNEICYMAAKLIRLETGVIVKTVNHQRKYIGPGTLTAMANNVTYRLLNDKSK